MTGRPRETWAAVRAWRWSPTWWSSTGRARVGTAASRTWTRWCTSCSSRPWPGRAARAGLPLGPGCPCWSCTRCRQRAGPARAAAPAAAATWPTSRPTWWGSPVSFSSSSLGRRHHGGMDAAPGPGLTAGVSSPGGCWWRRPALGDPNFARAVVLVLDHDEDGALGVVVNRPTTVGVADVLPDWQPFATDPGVLFQGGPVALDSALGLAVVPVGQRRGAAGLAARDRRPRAGRPRHPAGGAGRRDGRPADLRRLRRLGRGPARGRARRGRVVRRAEPRPATPSPRSRRRCGARCCAARAGTSRWCRPIRTTPR